MNFSAKVGANPHGYGLTEDQGEACTAANTAYSTAYLAAVNPETRTRGAVAAKNAARAALAAVLSGLVKIINGTPSVTDAMKIELGPSVRKMPAPIPPPANAPSIDIISITGRTVKLRLHGEDAMRRGKPAGVAWAEVYSYVGEAPPADVALWTRQANSTRPRVTITFGQSAQAQTVWLTASWFSPTAAKGPGSDPVSVNLPAAAPLPDEGKIRLAA
jgi:hypothetical protein